MERTFFELYFNKLAESLPKEFLNSVNEYLNLPTLPNDEIRSYKPHAINSLLSKVDSQDPNYFTLVQKLLLLGFIIKNYEYISIFLTDKLLSTAYLDYLNRIGKTCASDEYTFSQIDVFWKELAIAKMQFFPLTAGVCEFYSGFGVKQGLSKNALQTASFLRLLWSSGKLPYYQIHTHTPVLSNFNNKGWENSYKQVAKMLIAQPGIKGVIRGSWFFDPNLKNISPRLSYLRELPLLNGAKFYCTGVDETGSALATSKTRLKLYNEGKYTPTNYLLVWPREAIINWYKASL